MSERTKARTTNGSIEIRVRVPGRDAARMRSAIDCILSMTGRGKRLLGTDEFEDDKLYSFEEAFPDSTPGRRLRGLRTREGITQQELADTLGIKQSHVSGMESGARTIGIAMARRISKTYGVTHRAFL